MSRAISISDGQIVEFRLEATDSGEPDFAEALRYLREKLTTPEHWMPYHSASEFGVRKIGDQAYPFMKIWVSREALNFLKWCDLAKEHVRVLEDYQPAESDVLAISTANKTGISNV